jgi:hypothetical protein
VTATRAGFVWFFAAFGLLIVAGALIAGAAISFLSSLTPLYASIGFCVAAIACAMVGLARYIRHADT